MQDHLYTQSVMLADGGEERLFGIGRPRDRKLGMSTVLRWVNMDTLIGSSNCLLPRNFKRAKALSKCLEAGL